MKGIFGKKPRSLFSVGKVPHYGKVIEERIARLAKPKVPKGKMKLFRIPVRIPRGIKI
jgi:hypothetical protein